MLSISSTLADLGRSKRMELDREDKAVAVRIDDCIACRLCELRCPDLAITVEVKEPAEEKG